MFDTVEYLLHLEPGQSEAIINHLARDHPNLNILTSSLTGATVAHDNIFNYQYTVRPDMLRVYGGSLCKWMYGENYSTLTRRDTRLAIESLSDYLGADLKKAYITRFDIGINLVVNDTPHSYYKLFGPLKGVLPRVFDSSMYYTLYSGREVWNFYDKSAESRHSGLPVPPIFQGCNVMRIEQRYLKPSRLLGSRIMAKTLYNEKFYIKLVETFKARYMEIEKINRHELDISQISGVKDLQEAAVRELIKGMGGYNSFMERIKISQQRGQIDRERARQFRDYIKKLNSTSGKNVYVDENAQEITRKVSEYLRYCH